VKNLIRSLGLLSVLSLVSQGSWAALKCGNFSLVQDPNKSTEEFLETRRQIKIQGTQIPYVAKAGYLPLIGENGEQTACIFFTSYHVQAVQNQNRPVTFVFNGGPGSASIWLHVGSYGPVRLDLGKDGLHFSPQAQLIENDQSILDATDLVYIDPVNTGYSRPAPGHDVKEFYGIQNDGRSVAQFIREYLMFFKRQRSPVYIAGESYGTIRAAVISRMLQSDYAINVNGIVLISSALGMNIGDNGPNENDVSIALSLPSYAVGAQYYHKIGGQYADLPVEALYNRVKNYALGEYSDALKKGEDLSEEERSKTEENLAAMTGLSLSYIRSRDLRIKLFDFVGELLRDQGLLVSYHDLRVSGPIPTEESSAVNESSPFLYDAGMSFTTPMLEYFSSTFGIDSLMPYHVLINNNGWSRAATTERGYADAMEDLKVAMQFNKNLRVLVASGVYDPVTPPAFAEYNLKHLGLRSAKGRIKFLTLPGGHMSYLEERSRAQLRSEWEDLYSNDGSFLSRQE